HKPDWDWAFLRRALHEQARHHQDIGDNDRATSIYTIVQEIIYDIPKPSLSLADWRLFVEELREYATHLKYGYSEPLASEYNEYVKELTALISRSDRDE